MNFATRVFGCCFSLSMSSLTQSVTHNNFLTFVSLFILHHTVCNLWIEIIGCCQERLSSRHQNGKRNKHTYIRHYCLENVPFWFWPIEILPSSRWMTSASPRDICLFILMMYSPMQDSLSLTVDTSNPLFVCSAHHSPVQNRCSVTCLNRMGHFTMRIIRSPVTMRVAQMIYVLASHCFYADL